MHCALRGTELTLTIAGRLRGERCFLEDTTVAQIHVGKFIADSSSGGDILRRADVQKPVTKTPSATTE
jgi:hypothetical protein